MSAPSSTGDGSRAARSAAALRSLPWITILLVLAIGVASWPVMSSGAKIGLDPSFEAALGYAVQHGQHFGSDIAYTYGPLGFLAFAWPWFGPITLLALVFTGVIHFALCAVVVLGARQVVPVWQATVIAYLAGRETLHLLPYEALLVLVFAVCAALLLARDERRLAWVVPLGGVVTAIGLLGKLNDGVFIAAIVTLTVIALARPWWRGVLRLGAWTGVSTLVLWLVTGQRVADLWPYAASSYEVIRGFSQAMGLDQGPATHWLLLAYLLGVFVVARVAVDEAADRSPARRIALGLIGAIVAFAFFKTGFVRWHVAYALAAAVIAMFAVVRGRTARPMFLAVFVAVLVPVIAIWGDPIVLLNPVVQVRSLYREAAIAIRPGAWAAAEETTRTQLRAALALEPSILDALRDRTVEVDPWQTAVLVAWPELTWRPLPVFQSYSAYTPALDESNAAVLRGPNAPQRILRETTAVRPGGKTPIPVVIDGRDRWFEAPEAMLETFCRYDEMAASARWEVLALNERHCGAPESLGTVVARLGEAVTVPVETRPDRFVIVRVHGVDDSVLDRVVSTLYKSPEWTITLNGTDRYRLVPGTAVDGLLMAVPSTIVRSPGFSFGPPIRELAIAPRTASKGASTLSFEFLSVPLAGP